MIDPLPQISKERLIDLCRRHNVHKLSLFGSHLTGANTARSDIDILVEFAEGCTPGFAYFRIQDELSELFGGVVDLHTAGSLSRYFRQQVINEARVLYAE